MLNKFVCLKLACFSRYTAVRGMRTRNSVSTCTQIKYLVHVWSTFWSELIWSAVAPASLQWQTVFNNPLEKKWPIIASFISKNYIIKRWRTESAPCFRSILVTQLFTAIVSSFSPLLTTFPLSLWVFSVFFHCSFSITESIFSEVSTASSSGLWYLFFKVWKWATPEKRMAFLVQGCGADHKKNGKEYGFDILWQAQLVCLSLFLSLSLPGRGRGSGAPGRKSPLYGVNTRAPHGQELLSNGGSGGGVASAVQSLALMRHWNFASALALNV